ncbi:hypothetical protein [Methylobacter luteus]|uniref:hypothetical protein n=1 Tax=Methylobacter luteus TaxID=415 RepID=UPI000487DD04|nr:hypothetical protein [Methylobacter luteus]
MIKKIAYILIPACAATISVAGAETMPSNPTLLTVGEMDQVTAGAANADAAAVAYSPILAFAKTYTTALVVAPGSRLPGVGAAAAGGIAVAGGVGEGSTAGTSTTSNTGLTGPNVHGIQLDINRPGQLVSLSGSVGVAVSAPTAIPF